ncbi:LysR substrate-binding domain-containing protein [Streptomyces tricolor]|nr:LysR substrate-binding domain-containing protein [Streptomyces tricolor]
MALTPLGERFLERLRPAYGALRAAVADARAVARGGAGPLRLGFQGTADAYVLAAVAAFEAADPARTVDLVEIPYADPFGAVRRGAVDAAVVLLPVDEPDLVLGPVFSPAAADGGRLPDPSVRRPGPGRRGGRQGRPADRRGGAGTRVLACRPRPGPPARPHGHHPSRRPCPWSPPAAAPPPCRPTAAYHHRADVAYVPVDGLPDSALGLVWHRGRRRENGTGVRAGAGGRGGGRGQR